MLRKQFSRTGNSLSARAIDQVEIIFPNKTLPGTPGPEPVMQAFISPLALLGGLGGGGGGLLGLGGRSGGGGGSSTVTQTTGSSSGSSGPTTFQTVAILLLVGPIIFLIVVVALVLLYVYLKRTNLSSPTVTEK